MHDHPCWHPSYVLPKSARKARFSPRSLLTFPNRSGLSENRQGGGQTGGVTLGMKSLNSRAKLWREKECRGYSSAGRASRSQ